MSTISIACPIEGCTFSTGDVSEAVAVALLNTHAISHSNSSSSARNTTVSTGPKLNRPKVEMGITQEEWNLFQRRWIVFQSGSNISDSAAALQLFQCASEELGDAFLHISITQQPLAVLMASMKALAVIPAVTDVIRAELLELKQKRDEPFRTFSARVRGKAETCGYITKVECQCGLHQ